MGISDHGFKYREYTLSKVLRWINENDSKDAIKRVRIDVVSEWSLRLGDSFENPHTFYPSKSNEDTPDPFCIWGTAYDAINKLPIDVLNKIAVEMVINRDFYAKKYFCILVCDENQIKTLSGQKSFGTPYDAYDGRSKYINATTTCFYLNYLGGIVPSSIGG